jgi:hypothetical protein
MLKRLLILCVIGFAGYIAWPMWTAYEIFRATREGDHKTLQARVDWERLRASVKQSVRQRIADETTHRFGRSKLVEGVSLGLQRIAEWRSINRRIEEFATPSGLIAFDAARRERARLEGREPRTVGEMLSMLNERVKRIAFVSPTRVELEMADRIDPLKRIESVLELGPTGWKLTELRMFRVGG